MITGLGSILGTGAFVAVGLASARWGDLVIWAIPIAGLVATFNGLSSAFLAGHFPVAGGTFEYGYRTLGPWWGFSAGWLFLLAKTASAASAALGLGLYLGVEREALIAVIAVGAVTLLVGSGLRRTTAVNAVLVATTIAGLIGFAVGGIAGDGGGSWNGVDLASGGLPAAIAFLFVAFTGYGRIATLGEEVHSPEKTIPIAVIITLAVSATLYLLFELGGRALAGPGWGGLVELGTSPADLVDEPFRTLVTVGALTAMIGVLVNLVLGLSRVWLAMGRRGDMPEALARLDARSNPTRAIGVAGLLVAMTTLIGDIGLAWSFSAMTVLLYYGITNLAALSLDRSRLSAWAGLGSCLFLSFFVPTPVWVTGGALIGVGLAWKTVANRRS